MSDYKKVSNLYPNSGHVLLRVVYHTGLITYELFFERVKRPTGERFVTYLQTGDLVWAVQIAEELNIPEEDVRIY